MMRRLLRPLWMLLALILLIEAWLWDHLAPAVRWVVDVIPWRALKLRLAAWVARLSPAGALLVFAIPLIFYLSMEALALWPLARGHWFVALVMLAFAKLVGAAMTAFAFDVTRDKLLQMGWFRAGFERVVQWRDLAHHLADPYLLEIKAWWGGARSRSGSRFMRMVRYLRRRTQASR